MIMGSPRQFSLHVPVELWLILVEIVSRQKTLDCFLDADFFYVTFDWYDIYPFFENPYIAVAVPLIPIYRIGFRCACVRVAIVFNELVFVSLYL